MDGWMEKVIFDFQMCTFTWRCYFGNKYETSATAVFVRVQKNTLATSKSRMLLQPIFSINYQDFVFRYLPLFFLTLWFMSPNLNRLCNTAAKFAMIDRCFAFIYPHQSLESASLNNMQYDQYEIASATSGCFHIIFVW